MRRTAIAAAWLLGTTVPLLAGVVFVFGCCVLPFHRVVHRVLPLCHVAMDIMRGDRQQERQPQLPAREKDQPSKPIATEVSRVFRVASFSAPQIHVAPTAGTAYRSFISLGAMRCDQDIGLHLIAGILLI